MLNAITFLVFVFRLVVFCVRIAINLINLTIFCKLLATLGFFNASIEFSSYSDAFSNVFDVGTDATLNSFCVVALVEFLQSL